MEELIIANLFYLNLVGFKGIKHNFNFGLFHILSELSWI